MTDYQTKVKGKGKGKCEILSWNAVAFWRWDIETNECKICRNHIMNLCVECLNAQNKDSCKIVTGQCGCSYHYHCINSWLKSNNNCPIHTTIKWKFKTVDPNKISK